MAPGAVQFRFSLHLHRLAQLVIFFVSVSTALASSGSRFRTDFDAGSTQTRTPKSFGRGKVIESSTIAEPELKFRHGQIETLDPFRKWVQTKMHSANNIWEGHKKRQQRRQHLPAVQRPPGRVTRSILRDRIRSIFSFTGKSVTAYAYSMQLLPSDLAAIFTRVRLIDIDEIFDHIDDFTTGVMALIKNILTGSCRIFHRKASFYAYLLQRFWVDELAPGLSDFFTYSREMIFDTMRVLCQASSARMPPQSQMMIGTGLGILLAPYAAMILPALVLLFSYHSLLSQGIHLRLSSLSEWVSTAFVSRIPRQISSCHIKSIFRLRGGRICVESKPEYQTARSVSYEEYWDIVPISFAFQNSTNTQSTINQPCSPFSSASAFLRPHLAAWIVIAKEFLGSTKSKRRVLLGHFSAFSIRIRRKWTCGTMPRVFRWTKLKLSHLLDFRKFWSNQLSPLERIAVGVLAGAIAAPVMFPLFPSMVLTHIVSRFVFLDGTRSSSSSEFLSVRGGASSPSSLRKVSSFAPSAFSSGKPLQRSQIPRVDFDDETSFKEDLKVFGSVLWSSAKDFVDSTVKPILRHPRAKVIEPTREWIHSKAQEAREREKNDIVGKTFPSKRPPSDTDVALKKLSKEPIPAVIRVPILAWIMSEVLDFIGFLGDDERENPRRGEQLRRRVVTTTSKMQSKVKQTWKSKAEPKFQEWEKSLKNWWCRGSQEQKLWHPTTWKNRDVLVRSWHEQVTPKGQFTVGAVAGMMISPFVASALPPIFIAYGISEIYYKLYQTHSDWSLEKYLGELGKKTEATLMTLRHRFRRILRSLRETTPYSQDESRELFGSQVENDKMTNWVQWATPMSQHRHLPSSAPVPAPISVHRDSFWSVALRRGVIAGGLLGVVLSHEPNRIESNGEYDGHYHEILHGGGY